MVPEQDGRQRGLARGVLPQQRESLARNQSQADSIIRHPLAEAFGYAVEAEDILRPCLAKAHADFGSLLSIGTAKLPSMMPDRRAAIPPQTGVMPRSDTLRSTPTTFVFPAGIRV